MLNPNKSKEYDEGWEACEDAVDEDANPYDPQTEPKKHKDWANGWCDAEAEMQADWDDDDDADDWGDDDDDDDGFLDPI